MLCAIGKRSSIVIWGFTDIRRLRALFGDGDLRSSFADEVPVPIVTADFALS